MCRHTALSGDDPRLTWSHQKCGSIGTSPEKEKWFLHQECDPAVPDVHLDGLRLPHREIAARTHVEKLRVSPSKCLRLATGALLYIGNRQIHDDLGVPFFADHVRDLA
jgi:hypothetical protein